MINRDRPVRQVMMYSEEARESRFPVSLGAMAAGSNPPAVGARSGGDLVGPDLETRQRIRAESLGDRNVGGVAALRDQDAADPRHVVARVEHVPASADIGFEPAG